MYADMSQAGNSLRIGGVENEEGIGIWLDW